MYALTMIGAEGGLHRLFAHRAFDAGRGVKAVYAILGSMAAEGPVLWFASTHRQHHGLSDRPNDPHSPYYYGERELGHFEGLWHSHVAWMLRTKNADWLRFVPDLVKDRFVFEVGQLYFFWLALGFVLPTAFGWLWTGTWAGAALGFLWGGAVRMFLVHHVMWCVGSICHIVGSKRFETYDESRNLWPIGILAFGVGWHNNHHAFQGSARIGLYWWEIDVNYYVIWLLERLGLAWDVKLPTAELIEAKKLPSLPQVA
jgi:stearoyl-CoA desaturase (delta-9 desaturase)